MAVEFGQEKNIVASPKLILAFESLISDWLLNVIEKGEVHESDTMAIARDLVVLLFSETQ